MKTAAVELSAGAAGVPNLVPLPPCELRRSRDGAQGEELICDAGGFALGVRGRDDCTIAAICAACPIPAALADRRACLQLRPIRLVEKEGPLPERSATVGDFPQRSDTGDTAKPANGELRTFFSCRWFYTLNPRRQPESLAAQCNGCPYWFPRPRLELMRGYWPETEHIRAEVQRARTEPPSATRSTWARDAADRKRSWRTRLRESVFGWI